MTDIKADKIDVKIQRKFPRQQYVDIREQWCADHCVQFAEFATVLRPKSCDDLLEVVSETFREWWFLKPPVPIARSEAAIHEAGHFLVSEVLGFSAFEAKIQGDRGNWGGSSSSFIPRLERAPSGRARFSAGLVRGHAVALLAGSLTEAMLAAGDCCDSPGEIMTLLLLLDWLARRPGSRYIGELTDVLFWTAHLIYHFSSYIEAIAKLLIKYKSIRRCDPEIAKILIIVAEKRDEPFNLMSNKQKLILSKTFDHLPVKFEVLEKRISKATFQAGCSDYATEEVDL